MVPSLLAAVARLRRSLPLRTLVLLACAIAATVVFVEVADEVIDGNADRLDQTIALAIHRIDTPLLDRVMFFVTWCGAGVTLACVVGIVATWCLQLGRRRLAFVLTANALAAWGLNVLLKHLFARARPDLFDEITRPASYSFPSGHSMESMAVYGAVAAVVASAHPRSRPFVIPAAALLIVAIGFSRVYLGVHWPFDVIAGFAAGIPFVAVTVHLAHVATGTAGESA